VVVDTGDRVGVRDGALQVAETAEVRDVEHDHDVRGLDLLGRAVRAIGAAREQKVEALGDRGGIGDPRPAARAR